MASKIEDDALLSDLASAAPVGRDGSTDWLTFPRFDSDACFAGLLGDPSNGRWLIAPAGAPSNVRRSYRGDSLVLETVFSCVDGEVAVVDCMPVRGDQLDVVRLVECRATRALARPRARPDTVTVTRHEGAAVRDQRDTPPRGHRRSRFEAHQSVTGLKCVRRAGHGSAPMPRRRRSMVSVSPVYSSRIGKLSSTHISTRLPSAPVRRTAAPSVVVTGEIGEGVVESESPDQSWCSEVERRPGDGLAPRRQLTFVVREDARGSAQLEEAGRRSIQCRQTGRDVDRIRMAT